MNVDLRRLVASIENYCHTNDFKTLKFESAGVYQIQASKTDIARTVIGVRRCLNIFIKGSANDFEIIVGTGDWGKNVAASAIIGAITLGVGIIAAGASAAAYKYFENNLWRYLKAQVSSLVNSAAPTKCPFCGKTISYGFNLCPLCGRILK